MGAYCFIFNVISVPVGVSQILTSLPALRMLPRILTSIRTSRDSKAWIKMLNVSGRWSLVTGWNWVIGKDACRQESRVDSAQRLALHPGYMRDMELKKSISDTERALRSYGAVSETAWTTDKGERPASTHDAAPPPGAQEERVVVPVFPAYVSLCEQKWLICDSQRFGTLPMPLLGAERPVNSTKWTLWALRGLWMKLGRGV